MNGYAIMAPAKLGGPLERAAGALLTPWQKDIRISAKARMQRWLLARPPAGFQGQQTFAVPSVPGGIRDDTDSYGQTPNDIA